MFSMLSKVPRGSINHSLLDSLSYFFKSLISTLNNKEKIIEFENLFAEHVGRKYCVSFPFARTAIYYALKLNNFPKGTEVIMPPISIKGILDVVISLGLTPKYVDLDLNNFCFDEKKLHDAINEKTGAIIITYLFGTAPNIEKLIEICKKKNIFVLEDFSQGLNAKVNEKKLGCFGDCSIYSSSAIKQIDTFGGGHFFSDDEQFVLKIRKEQKSLNKSHRIFLVRKILKNLIYNFATNQILFNLLTKPILRLSKIFGADINRMTGNRDKRPLKKIPSQWFQSYTSFQAQVGIRELLRVTSFDEKRVEHAKKVMEFGQHLKFAQRNNKENHTYWQLVTYANNPEEFIKKLGSFGVDACTSSLELLSELKEYPGSTHTPNGSKIHKQGVFIPCFSRMSKFQKKIVYEALKSISN